MAKIEITAPFEFNEKGTRHTYVLRPDMGIVSHFPRKVCEAAVKAGSANFVGEEPARDTKAETRAKRKSETQGE